MADEPVAEPLDEQPEEEGGPVKSFLEHLEDLRWVLIKSGTAAGVAMLVCLLGGNYLMRVLEWPLHHNPAVNAGLVLVNYVTRVLGLPQRQLSRKAPEMQTVRLFFGTNQLSELHLAPNNPLTALVGTNAFVRVDLLPVLQGTNHVLAWQAQADPDPPAPGLNIQIINLSPAGSFVVATKAAFYGGIVLASPFIFYFVAHFVFPALKLREKKYVYRGLGLRRWALHYRGLLLLLHPYAGGAGGLGAVCRVARVYGQPVAGGGLRGVCVQVHAGHGGGLRAAGGGADAGEDRRAQLSAPGQRPALRDRRFAPCWGPS